LKVSAENLSTHLARGVPRIALVSGDEPLQVGEACDAIRNQARDAGFTERELYFAERGFDWQALTMASRSLSLFSERKIVEVRLGGARMDQDASATIADLAIAQTDEVLVLIIADKIDKRSLKAKWVEAIEKHGIHVQIWPVELSRLPTWIRMRMSRRGLEVDTEVATMIAERVEGNLLAAHQEIEKLALLQPAGKIDANMALEAVTDNTRFDVMQLGVAAMSGQSSRALRILAGLHEEGIEPTLILWWLNKDLQWLARIAHHIRSGQSIDMAMNAEYVWQPRQAAMKHALERLKLPAIQMLLRDANKVDRTIKGMPGDPWLELQALVARLAGVRMKRAA